LPKRLLVRFEIKRPVVIQAWGYCLGRFMRHLVALAMLVIDDACGLRRSCSVSDPLLFDLTLTFALSLWLQFGGGFSESLVECGRAGLGELV
jgi:hypothetical protein